MVTYTTEPICMHYITLVYVKLVYKHSVIKKLQRNLLIGITYITISVHLLVTWIFLNKQP